jgi:uncharacterized tellurite resistance protein B-like protein
MQFDKEQEMIQAMEDLSSYSREERLQFCRVVANMIGADHKVTEEEQQHLAMLVWQSGLSMSEEDVAKVVNDELEKPTPLAELLQGIDKPEMKPWLYRVMVELAYADEDLAPEEEQKLAEMAEIFELNLTAAQELIQWTKDSIALERREMDIMARL